MSRIGLKPIELPEGVTFTLADNKAMIKGPKGTLEIAIPTHITVKVDGRTVTCSRADDAKQSRQLHGTTRANLASAVVGVTAGFVKELVIVGIGYRAEQKGENVEMHVGYSHPITIAPMKDAKIIVKSHTEITVEGISKQAVGQTAALIRATRRPEPYNGKGVMYKGEHIIRKEGKRAATAANA